jgi:seryl-tRNA synthetase
MLEELGSEHSSTVDTPLTIIRFLSLLHGYMSQAHATLPSIRRVCSFQQLLVYRRFSQIRTQRPATAPKQYPDLKGIRQNVEVYSNNCIDRKYKAHAEFPADIARLTKEAQVVSADIPELSKKINAIQREITAVHASRESSNSSAERTVAATKEAIVLREALSEKERVKSSYDATAHELALSLPNLTSPETPLNGNPRPISYINHDPAQAAAIDSHTSHVEIGISLSILDFGSAATSTGWGFYFLVNEGALLEQALVQCAISVALHRGWTAVAPPSVVYSYMADACGFQPRDQNDEQQIWQIEQAEKDAGKPQRSLAATAEIPLAAMYAGKDIPEEQLPLKFIGSSRCYRAEAGARGVDTKGLYRVHEFTKVEMFAWTGSGDESRNTQLSTIVFEEMLSIQKEILSSLGLPCRVLEMPSSDLGASAFRKIDIEALFPSRMSRDEGWGEVTSLSICTDYQSRRLGTRILQKSGKRGKFPHTVNGTAMAVPRVLAAILEHGWREEERCVVIPEVLRPYMGGQEKIREKAKI